MFNEKTVESKELNLKLSTGKFGRQAGGAIIVEMGDTVVMATACSAKESKNLPFFPLTVDYREKMYAAGKIPGGFFKREARPSTREILVSRLIDRPIRPLFPDKYRNETQLICQTISYDQVNSSDILAITGASAALAVSEAPFGGPVGAVRIGRIGDKLIINPTAAQQKESNLDLVVAGTRKAITMVESQAGILDEATYLQALELAHNTIVKVVDLIDELVKAAGKPKIEFKAPEVDEALMSEIKAHYTDKFRTSLDLDTKAEREDKARELHNEIHAHFEARYQETPELKAVVSDYMHDIEYDVIRHMLVHEKRRIDKRRLDEVRQVECEVDVFRRHHGSSLFTRGETQALAILTLGGGEDEQTIDGMDERYTDRFYLHYNFPPFSVGEAGRFGFTGRREIGHGELASKALRAVLPTQNEFPYTIRMVTEILESNGSSSMATVCSSSMAMMAGGVPLKGSVAGVAMGLFMDGDAYSVLTDIQGAEDHYGDMDFKVAGTREGISALQMDIKIEGVSLEIMKVALEEARKSRLHLLDLMDAAIPAPREVISAYAPRILIHNIPKDRIGDVIGPGGKVIRRISETYGVKIEVTEEGNRGIVKVLSVDGPSGEDAMAEIKGITEEPEAGKIYYKCTVKRVENYGAFCEFLPGREGLVHVSRLSKKGRVNAASDILSEGDIITLKLLEVDRQGRYNLSASDVEENDF